MFKRDSRSEALIQSLVSATTRIQGDLVFSGGMHLDGAVTGNVRAVGDEVSRLVVGQTGLIEGSVEADVVELHGAVRGDILARQRAVLGARARVEGNLHYGVIEMAAGAHIKGKLVRLGNEAVP